MFGWKLPGRGSRSKVFMALLVAVFVGTACAANTGDESGGQPAGPPSGPGAPSSSGQITTPPAGPVTEGPTLDMSIFPEVGESSFVTANEREQLSYGTGDYAYSRGYNAAAEFDDAEAGGAHGEPSAREPAPMPEPDPTREIVEADIFKLEGDTLYVLNSYRGLIVIDMSDPDHPAVLGRLPFQATPVDMYVRDGRAYIVMSDYFQYWQYDQDADPLGFHGSQVLIADVSEPTDPYAMGSLLLEGEVTDTRMVGDVLYTVSKRNPEYWRYNTADWEDRTWVVSLNVADPAAITEIDRIEFQGTSTLIHVAPHAIFVAAQDPNYYLTSEDYEQETLLTYIDISDPAGDLQERGSIYLPGYIADKFKMDYHEATLRVFSQRWYGSSDGYLYAVDLSFPDELAIAGELEITQDNYGYLQATRFDGARAYAMTTRWTSGNNIDELHTFDLSDPTHLVKSATIRIYTNISHFETRGERLIALGRSDRNNQNRRVEILLFDVSDITAPRTIASVELGTRYSYSSAISDYKAFRVVDELELILVPLSYGINVEPWYFQGTQLVHWARDGLQEAGQIENVAQVKRAFVVEDRLVAFSERQLQVIDATDLDHPVVTADMYLIRNVLDVFNVQGRAVQLIGDIEDGGYYFDVLPFGAEDDAPALAHLALPFTSQPIVFREGDVLHLLGYEPDFGQTIRNADFQAVLEPRLRGFLDFSDQADSIYRPGYSFYYYYWNPSSGLALDNRILPYTERHIVELPNDRREWDSELKMIDMSDIDHPRIAEGSVPMNDYPFVNKVMHGNVLHSTHVEETTTQDGETLLYHVRSFVDRIDVTDPDHPVELPSLNIPGMLVDVSADGTLLYTVDYQWDDFGRRRNSLNVLRVEGEEAVLVEVIGVSDQVNRAVFRDNNVWLVSHKYAWWGVQSDTVSSRQPYTVLHRYAFEDTGALAEAASGRLHGYLFDLLDVEGTDAYLASRFPYGLLVLDVSDPNTPEIRHAARSIGYISKIVENEGYLYTPLGWYGVHRTAIAE